jgi:hypothetical protein
MMRLTLLVSTTLIISSGVTYAQGTLPSVPVPGTHGGAVVGPTPPPDNPGKVITITPTFNVPQPTFPNTPPPPPAPGVIITIPAPHG